jgi:hypothetical protein
MTKQFMTALMISLMLSTSVLAQEDKSSASQDDVEGSIKDEMEPNPDSIPVLKKIKGAKEDLTYDYLGKKLGMDAWLLSGPDVMQIVYTHKDLDGAMLGGVLIGPDAKEVSSTLTKEFMARYPKRAQEIIVAVRSHQAKVAADAKNSPVYAAKNTAAVTDEKPADAAPAGAANSPSEKLWARLQSTGQITFGNNESTPVIYAILDPAQKETKVVWAALGPLAKDNKVTLHVVPLGLTTADSIMEIATVLGSKDPSASWEKVMKGDTVIGETPPDTSGVLGMKNNVDLAQSLSLRQLPFMVYREAGGKIRILRGVPKQWDEFLKEINVSK